METTRTLPIILAAAAMMALWSPLSAQTAGPASAAKQTTRDACSFLTEGEVDRLINRGQRAYGTAESVPLRGGAGSVCEYPIGAQVVLFSGPRSQEEFEAFLKTYNRDRERRHPVSGIGDRAYIMFPTPRHKNEDRLAYLVTNVGPHTLGVSMAARDGMGDSPMMEYCRRGQLSREECAKLEADKSETAESLQPAVKEVAKAVVAKLRS